MGLYYSSARKCRVYCIGKKKVDRKGTYNYHVEMPISITQLAKSFAQSAKTALLSVMEAMVLIFGVVVFVFVAVLSADIGTDDND